MLPPQKSTADQIVQPLLTTLQQVHDQAKVEQQRTQQHIELMAAMAAQTAAMQALADSNKEIAGVLMQLIVTPDDDEPDDVDRSQGMGDSKGGYLKPDATKSEPVPLSKQTINQMQSVQDNFNQLQKSVQTFATAFLQKRTDDMMRNLL
jgi:hypothetical protein